MPERGFVFCCFNNSYKLTPEFFDIWMRLLHQVRDSVLWLLRSNPAAETNLRREAQARGIDPRRLVFASRIERDAYLARYRLADLFLDTLPYNAGTTASDALWAGVPVLTCAGQTFSARMAGSLLNAVGLPELVTNRPADYEALAVKLATEPRLLDAIKKKLARNRLTAPLFDTDRFRRHIEAAYTTMWERYQRGEPPESFAVAPLESDLKAAPSRSAATHASPERSETDTAFGQAFALHRAGRFVEAETLYRRILAIQPDHFDSLHLLGVCYHQRGEHAQALRQIDAALKLNPDSASAHSNHGATLRELKRLDEALACYEKALALKPDHAEALYNRGNALRDLHRFVEAVASYDRALVLSPDHADALYNRARALAKLVRYEEAVASYEQALARKSDHAEAFNNRGIALAELKRFDEALASFSDALALKPDYIDALNNRGNVLREFRRFNEALASFDQALTRKPDYSDAFNNRGIALAELKQFDAAVASFNRAIALKLDYAEAYHNRGNALRDLQQHETALQSYDRAIALKPDFAFLYGMRLHTKMHLCDWRDVDAEFTQLAARIERSQKTSPPFPVLAVTGSLPLQRKAAEIWVQEKCLLSYALPKLPKYPKHDKIRVGYYSADYHNHATAYLMAELFERHDRAKFELIAFSYGPDSKDEMRQRLVAAFDQFIDVRAQSDKEVAQLARKLGVDIAVDLKGFTTDGRAGIFAERTAPIQVNYLGYPGTMGAEYIDYLIADKTLIPEESQPHYSEKIVYLPNSYQVNDAKRRISDKAFTRAELGLPSSGFVFCCFNNNYKITPGTFDGWMRILKRVEGSVLWLLEDSATAADNLRKEAVQRAVGAERLVFAKRMPLPEHLARHRVADLFLDTLPCNAHTTASDALWAGLPVLTCMGEAFASRVAASLLNAIDLPELITHTQEEYEALAVELATNPQRLAQIKQKLAQNRLTTPLFDTPLFTKHIEAAYTAMYERYHTDLQSDHIYIQQ